MLIVQFLQYTCAYGIIKLKAVREWRKLILITRNVWQSLANSPLGAAVSPPSK